MKIRTLIVDDEAHARERLLQLLKGDADFEVVGECANGRQAIERAKREKCDLLFLDVQMPRLTGFEVCETLAAEGTLPLVVFVTAYDQYALKAFEVHAVDYLLKPFDRERFLKTLQRVKEQLHRATEGIREKQLAALLEDLRHGAKKSDRLILKENGRVVFVRPETIDWLEADGNYVKVHAGSESHYVRETLAGLEAQLPTEKFMRISRSVVVNLDRIKEFQPMFYGDYAVLLQSGTKLSMSRNFRDRLEKMLVRRA